MTSRCKTSNVKKYVKIDVVSEITIAINADTASSVEIAKFIKLLKFL